MCINYKPPTKDVVAAMTGADPSYSENWPEETWQDYAAPIVRAGEDREPELIVGTYGMIPKRKQQPGRPLSTMNARAETIGEKQAFSFPWRRVQTCLLPATMFYEPNYESGRPQRWAIGMADREPFCVAGLWRAWEEPEGGYSFSFTQITINADRHPLMRRFHKPEDEKRSLVIIPKTHYDDWLNAGTPDMARAFLTLTPAEEMAAWPAEAGYGAPKSTAQSSLF